MTMLPKAVYWGNKTCFLNENNQNGWDPLDPGLLLALGTSYKIFQRYLYPSSLQSMHPLHFSCEVWWTSVGICTPIFYICTAKMNRTKVPRRHNRLRIQCCHLTCDAGHNCSAGSIPDSGPSTFCGCCQKKKKCSGFPWFFFMTMTQTVKCSPLWLNSVGIKVLDRNASVSSFIKHTKTW